MIKTLGQLNKNVVKAQNKYRKKQNFLADQIATLKGEKYAMKYPHLLNYLFKLGKETLPKIKNAVRFETMGPFGLANECSIYFYSKGTKTHTEGRCLAGATFRHFGDGFALKNYNKKKKGALDNSLAAANGLNYEDIELSEKMTIDWFVKFARKRWNK